MVGCAGNHDYPGPGRAGPVDLVGAMGGGGRWGITSPAVVRIASGGMVVAVAVLPWFRTDSPVETCRSLAAQAAEVDADYRILMGHWAVSEAVMSTGETVGAREPSIPLPTLLSLPFDAAIFGHIHRPQVLCPGNGGKLPIVLHTGALVRRDFGEAGDPRLAYVVDLFRRRVEHIEIPARRFVAWDVHAMALRDAQPPEAVRDAIVRVDIKGREDELVRVDARVIRERLEAAGAHWVEARVVPEPSRRARIEGLTERVAPLEALDRWLEMRSDLDAATRQQVKNAVLRLLEGGVAGCGAVAAAG